MSRSGGIDQKSAAARYIAARIAGIMWMLFGNKTHVRPVENGQTVERYCDECKKVQTLVECDVKDRVTVFFVEVGDMEMRRMVCRDCGEDYDLPEVEAPARPVPVAPRSAPPPVKTESELDAMLADLKKKMRS
jgi:hypothetical protein